MERRGRTGPSSISAGASSSPATRRTRCRRTAGSAATPASRMRTTWPGSWRMVLRGDAGPELLDTYDAERRPVGTFTTEQAYSRYVTRTAPYLGTDGMQPVAPDLERRARLPLRLAGDLPRRRPGTAAREPARVARARRHARARTPGSSRDGERISTLDLFGSRFVILGGANAHSWIECRASPPASEPGASRRRSSIRWERRLRGSRWHACRQLRPDVQHRPRAPRRLRRVAVENGHRIRRLPSLARCRRRSANP